MFLVVSENGSLLLTSNSHLSSRKHIKLGYYLPGEGRYSFDITFDLMLCWRPAGEVSRNIQRLRMIKQ
jgi:hypothetical protein